MIIWVSIVFINHQSHYLTSHVITVTASPIGTDGYKFTTLIEVFISLGDMLHSFASSKNDDELKNLCLVLFKNINIKHFKIFRSAIYR